MNTGNNGDSKTIDLLIAASDPVGTMILRALADGPYQIRHRTVTSVPDLEAALDGGTWQGVVSGGGNDGIPPRDALDALKRRQLDMPFVIVSSGLGADDVVDLLRAGASDVVSPDRLGRLPLVMDREIHDAWLRKERREVEGERKKLEEQLIQIQKMDAIGQLAGGIAHDFNNFLSVIMGYSELVHSALKTNSPADSVLPDVEEIRAAADRASALTRQLLAFSRRQVLQPTLIDLNCSVENMRKMLSRLIGENVRLDTRYASGLPRIRVDAGQIEQVVMNLSVNARDAMNAEGTLTLSTALIDVPGVNTTMIPAGRYVALIASDTGHGMDKATQERIFEPFFTTKEKGKGTGLGLATVYGIVKQSGGYITVDSEVGKGTTFTLLFPPIQDGAEPGASSVPRPAQGSRRVMLVDDDAAVRSMVGKFLRKSGYDVVDASSGEQALDIMTAGKQDFGLMITDVVMPGISGIELADRLIAMGHQLPVLFMSGYLDRSGLEDDLRRPNAAFLMKPFAADTLSDKIRELLPGPR